MECFSSQIKVATKLLRGLTRYEASKKGDKKINGIRKSLTENRDQNKKLKLKNNKN